MLFFCVLAKAEDNGNSNFPNLAFPLSAFNRYGLLHQFRRVGFHSIHTPGIQTRCSQIPPPTAFAFVADRVINKERLADDRFRESQALLRIFWPA